MAYVPVATDVSQPTGDKAVASAAPEFRTLKAFTSSIEAQVLSFQAELDAILAGIGAGNNSAALAAALAASSGSNLVGFINTGVGAVYRTEQQKLRDTFTSPFDYGAVGDGVTDDSVAVQNAVNRGNVKFIGTFAFNNITVPSYTVLDFTGAHLVGNNIANPLFKSAVAAESIYLNGAGGLVSGTVDSILQLNGSTNQPTSIAHYARFIRVDGLNVSGVGSAINKLFDLQNAVMQFYAAQVGAFTYNGINANGKCVECHIDSSVIFGSSGATGTYGIKLYSSGGTVYFNEGWHITNSTIDNFEKRFDVRDIFVLACSNSYIGSSSGGASFQGQTATNVLTVNSITTGALVVGAALTGAGVAANTIISSFGTGTGGVGTYNLNQAVGTIAAEAMTTAGGGYGFDFSAPSTNLCECITLGNGGTISGKIRFKSSAGYAFSALIQNTVFTGMGSGDSVEVQNNAANISIDNILFKAGNPLSIGVHTSGGGNNSIAVKNLTFDGTYGNGVKYDHTTGSNNVIGAIYGSVTGELWQHPAALLVRKTSAPVASAITCALWRQYNTADLAGAYVVGATIVSLVVNLAKGEKGVIDISFPCTGMNAATQLLQITPPAGMRLPGFGTGAWAAEFIYTQTAGGLIVASIPYYVDVDIVAGTLLIKNQAGNTITMQSHARFGIARGW